MPIILIVDDRAPNRDYLTTLLGYAGHTALEAANAEHALEIVRTARPDLVIADVVMPSIDGFEFVRQLRSDPEIAHTRVMFYTATYLEAEARAGGSVWCAACAGQAGRAAADLRHDSAGAGCAGACTNIAIGRRV